MLIIFCGDTFNKGVDIMFADEYKCARDSGIRVCVVIPVGDGEKRGISINMGQYETGIYRGWMLTPNEYEHLYYSLLEKNIELINMPNEYTFCHYLPENYNVIKEFTAKTTFKKLGVDGFRYEDFKEELEIFGNNPIIIKDYVKSEKAYWYEACFIPDVTDRVNVECVVNRFIELRGVNLNEGLVFREYVELERSAGEFRFFIFNKKIVTFYNYFGFVKGGVDVLGAIEIVEKIIPHIKSNFFTVDVAKRVDGGWMVIELGDGQVSGLINNVNIINGFYGGIKLFGNLKKRCNFVL